MPGTYVGVGLFGLNGHQVHSKLFAHPHAKLVATAGLDRQHLKLPDTLTPAPVHYASLEEMLTDVHVDLVSLCSPIRAEQARQAIRCLLAGKHVYAEKPCATSETELDAIIETARQTGHRFHEMAGTAFEAPFATMSRLIRQGKIGQVVQVFAQKSYPWHDRRPSDEAIDGGLVTWVGVHALRMICHVTGMKGRLLHASETRSGNPRGEQDGSRMACAMQLELENGALATAIANYCNPPTFGRWGNEHLRVFGTAGMIECTDGRSDEVRFYPNDGEMQAIASAHEGLDFFDTYIASLMGLVRMPMGLEDELHPTRLSLQAKRHIEGTDGRR